jgi:hypothetical protein
MMRIRARLAVLLGSIAVVLGAGAGFAFASIPAPDGTINGCYKTSNPAQGALIVIDSTATCPSGTSSLNWNQTGPPGPSTAGATGLDLVFVQATGNPGNVTTIAYCPSDHPYVVSGGFSTNSSPVNASFPVSGNGNGTGPEGTSGNGWAAADTTGSPIGVFAICAK